MTVNSAMVKVAEWSDVSGMNPVLAKFTRLKAPKQEFEKNKTYIMTALLEEPFMMLKNQENSNEVLQGNDQFEGYCKDLADLIAKKLDINCMFDVLQITVQSKPEK
jgi:ionotropic glutamate receptor